MPFVTVPGSHGGQVVVQFVSGAYATLAKDLLGDQTGTLVVGPGSTNLTAGGVTGIGPVGDVDITDATDDTGQLILTGVGTDLSFNSASGAGTIIAGGGQDTFGLGAGDWFLLTPETRSLVTLGSGADTVVMDGAETVVGGAGDDTIFNSGTGGLVDQESGALLYIAGAGNSTVNAGSGALVAFGGTGTTTYNLGTGFAVIVAGPGIADIDGGSTSSDFFGTGSSSINYDGNTNNNDLIAGSGNETLNAANATGANLFFAGTGNDSITAGSGNDILVAGLGNATMTGGGGGNLFVFADTAATTPTTDLITDFSSEDLLSLENGITYISQHDSAGDLQLVLSDGTTVTFAGISSIDPSQIHH